MQSAHRNLICCLLATEIADYETKPIFEQIRLTQDFHELLSDVTLRVTSEDLISVVGEQNGLLAFLCDPAECFKAALAIRDAMLGQDRYRDLQLRIGIDLGKARIAKDGFGHPHVNGEARDDADRLMRQGRPRQISVSRRFVEVLSRSAPELVESLEYQGLYSDNIGPPLCWYRTPAPQDTASRSLSDQLLVPALSSDAIDTPSQPKLAPMALAMRSAAKVHERLRRSRLGYPLVLLVVVSAIVALLLRVGDEMPTFKPTAQVSVVTPQPIAPEDPASSPRGVEAPVGRFDSSSAPVASQETIDPNAMTPPEFAKDSQQPLPAPSSRVPEPGEDAVAAGPGEELHAPGKAHSAASPEKKKKRSKHRLQNKADEEAHLPAKDDATSDPMLGCARIELPTKRLECFDKLKRR